MKNTIEYGMHELSRQELISTQGGVLNWIFSAAAAVAIVGRAGFDCGRELYRAIN